jgi:hypothetical protein
MPYANTPYITAERRVKRRTLRQNAIHYSKTSYIAAKRRTLRQNAMYYRKTTCKRSFTVKRSAKGHSTQRDAELFDKK